MPVNFLNWNCNGVFSKYENLQLLIKKYDPSVILLQETNLRKTKNFFLKNYKTYRKELESMDRVHGGVILCVKNSIMHSEINLQTNLQAIAISLHFQKKILTLCCLYLPPNLVIQKQNIDEIINQLPLPFLILGDFNSHSPLWGCNYVNSKGKIIEQILEQDDISLFNINEPTHFSSAHNSWSSIDLIIGSSALGDSLRIFHDNDMAGSDHVPMLIQFNDPSLPSNLNMNLPAKWNFKKANWQIFKELCSNLPEIDFNQNIDTIVNFFCDHILQYASLSIPKIQQHRRKSVPWWTDECATAIRNRRKALKMLKNYPCEFNLINYRKLRAKAQYVLKQAKRTSWRIFISTINENTPPTVLWSKIRKLGFKNFNSSPSCIHIDNTPNYDTDSISNAFALSFAKTASDENQNRAFLDVKNQTNTDLNIQEATHEPFNSVITIEELNCAITNSKCSAPGPDLIYLQFIKNASENVIFSLLQIFNKIWISRTFPKNWKTALILPFLKPNKNPFYIDSYRPISLTSNLCKLLEKIINKRLLWILETNNRLSPTQCGFRPCRSTLQQLTFTNSEIKKSVENKTHLLAIFFDIQKAFDTIWKFKIIKTLQSWNIQGNMLYFIINFLQDRRFRIKIADTFSEEYSLENGVPQGTVISPTLFIIGINDLPEVIPSPIKKTLFADDLKISIACKDVELGESLLQQATNRLVEWSEQNGLKFSQTKSSAIHICKLYKCTHSLKIHLDNVRIPTTNSIKYLGITFDDNLSWTSHVEDIRNKCFRRLNLLKKTLSHNIWFR